MLKKAIEQWPSQPGKALLRASEISLIDQAKWISPVLDFGCGDGLVTRLTGKKVQVGLDVSFKMCELGVRSRTYLGVVNGDGIYLPFPGNYFNFVFSNSVLEHVSNLKDILTEIYRVTRENGSFVFTVPSPRKPDFLFYSDNKLYKDARVGNKYKDYFSEFWQHRNYLTGKEWRRLLVQIGFKRIRICYYENRKTSRLIDMLRSVEISFKKWENFSRERDYVKQAWQLITFKYLYPYFKLKASLANGGGIYITARKESRK
jgi:ubiquinone/menaquinone biosynthesis C-methylase UbiE